MLKKNKNLEIPVPLPLTNKRTHMFSPVVIFGFLPEFELSVLFLSDDVWDLIKAVFMSLIYIYIQSTPLNRATSRPGCFDPIKRGNILTEIL